MQVTGSSFGVPIQPKNNHSRGQASQSPADTAVTFKDTRTDNAQGACCEVTGEAKYYSLLCVLGCAWTGAVIYIGASIANNEYPF